MLIGFIPVTVVILPGNRPYDAGCGDKRRVLTYQQALSSVEVNMIGLTVTLALICLCFKEPVLQL